MQLRIRISIFIGKLGSNRSQFSCMALFLQVLFYGFVVLVLCMAYPLSVGLFGGSGKKWRITSTQPESAVPFLLVLVMFLWSVYLLRRSLCCQRRAERRTEARHSDDFDAFMPIPSQTSMTEPRQSVKSSADSEVSESSVMEI